MASMENTTSWKQIQQGLRETERLIGRKEYNMAMVKARQTLEFMVRCLAEKACVVEGDLSDTIDQLYEGRWISRTTKDHYHNIRILGNKAVHEGDDTAYDANQAYQLLAQEVVAFADELGVRGPSRPPQARQGGQGARRSPVRSGGARRPSTSSRPSGRKGAKKRRKLPPSYYALRILVPVLAVILLILVIRLILPGGEEAEQTTATTTQTETQTEPVTQETPPETTEAAAEEGTYQVTGDGVNVRSEPSTSGRVLVQLSRGAVVEYVRRYNNDWTVINYDGQEAYISSQYIARQDGAAQGGEEVTEEMAAEGQE